MEVFKVIIAGGRDFLNYALLKETCDKLLITKRVEYKIVVICGMAKGADDLGRLYAYKEGFEVEEHPADWDQYGKRAGFIRNAQMATVAHGLIAFWDGQSSGTKDMIERAKARDLLVAIQPY